MKNTSIRTTLKMVAALSVATVIALGANTTRLESQMGSKLTIDGTSTIHDWSVAGQLIGGYIEFEPDYYGALTGGSAQTLVGKKVNPKLDVTIPVRSLKSDKKPMDNVMYNAMKQKEHPQIKYALKEMALKEAPKAATGPFVFDTEGELTVSGVTKAVKMDVTMEKVDEAKFKFIGKAPLKMTDFKIDPPAPSLALGLIKTADEVTVTFEWLTSHASQSVKAQ